MYAVMFFCLFPQLKKYIYIYLGEQNFMVKCQREVELVFKLNNDFDEIEYKQSKSLELD